MSTIIDKITEEIEAYKTGTIEIMDGMSFSTYTTARRIAMCKAQQFDGGKIDSQGNIKYWFDIVTPRVNAEVKNIDYDTKDVMLESDQAKDALRVRIATADIREWLKSTRQGEKINSSIEQTSEDGSVVYKEDKDDGYRTLGLTNVMVLNQTVSCINDSDVIEYATYSPVDLQMMTDVWETKEVEKLLKLGSKDSKTKIFEYHIYERNGLLSESEYANEKGQQYIKDKNKAERFLRCKVIVGASKKDKPEVVLFCEKMNKMPYKDGHRTSYKGRWLRLGLYEALFDCQTRANEIGNQIARGLEWSSKAIFRSNDALVQNILTQLQNGDVIKSNDLAQVDTRMHNLDQLIADWNRNLQLADSIANSYEVVTGESMPSGTPFRLASQQNLNANKLFDFIREKHGLVLQDVIETWVLAKHLKELRAKDVIRLTADSGVLPFYYDAVIDDWYRQNLFAFPPHTEEIAQTIKEEMKKQMSKKTELMLKNEKEMWEDFVPRCRVVITGENYAQAAELETLSSFIALEQDPIRRTALISMAMAKKGIDIDSLPKTPPAPVQPTPSPMQQNNLAPQNTVV